MAGGANSGDDEIYSINVTPLVDITLVLLIIMMVTAKVIVATGMQVELPKAASGEDVPKVFTVDITSDGKTFFQRLHLIAKPIILSSIDEILIVLLVMASAKLRLHYAREHDDRDDQHDHFKLIHNDNSPV